MTSLSDLTIDELADGICLRAGRIAAAEAELLAWIGEFDERDGWGGHGILSCAHWLSWKTGLSPGAARERVRVAKSLRELPEVADAFAQGLMSWSQARALTRVARPDDGIDWVTIARSSSGAQIEKIVRGMRRAKSLEEAREDCERAAWLVRTRKSYDADGNLVMTIYAKAEIAPVVEAAFEAKRTELERERLSRPMSLSKRETFPREPRSTAASSIVSALAGSRPETFPRERPTPIRPTYRGSLTETRCSRWHRTCSAATSPLRTPPGATGTG